MHTMLSLSLRWRVFYGFSTGRGTLFTSGWRYAAGLTRQSHLHRTHFHLKMKKETLFIRCIVQIRRHFSDGRNSVTLSEKSSQNTKLSFVVTTGYRIFHFPLCSRWTGEQLRISPKTVKTGMQSRNQCQLFLSLDICELHTGRLRCCRREFLFGFGKPNSIHPCWAFKC